MLPKYVITKDGNFKKTEFYQKVDQCEVCFSEEKLELHHFAPKHLFGDESDKWPVAFLCVPCHSKWHKFATPSMCEIKKPATFL